MGLRLSGTSWGSAHGQVTLPAAPAELLLLLVQLVLLISWAFKSEITGADFRDAKHLWLQRKPSEAVL